MNNNRLNPNVSIDCVVFGFDLDQLNVLTIERGIDAKGNKMQLALPGDLIMDNQNLDENAQRILKELTGLENIFMEQIGAFGDPNRTKNKEDLDWLNSIREVPTARVVTIAYYSLVKIQDYIVAPSSFAKSVKWVPVKKIEDLVFDHFEILQAGINKLKIDIVSKPIGYFLLPEKFTITQLNNLYEAILDKPIDKRNFRRKISKLDILIDLNEKQKDVAHKPSSFVKFNLKKYQKLFSNNSKNVVFN